MQGCVPRGVLSPHVSSVEQQVLQVLHVPEAAGLGDGGSLLGPGHGPDPQAEPGALSPCPRLPGGLPASRFRRWSPAEHGRAGAARSRGRPPRPGRCGTRVSDHGCPCSPVRRPGPAGSEGKNVGIHARPASFRSGVTRRSSEGWACTDRQGSRIPLACGTVHGREPVSRAEVQVSAAILQHLQQVGGVVQLGGKAQRTL